MCEVIDTQNEPVPPHHPNVEPGKVETLAASLRYWWFVLIPILAWMLRVEVGLAASVSGPETYKEFVEEQFKGLHDKIDHLETLINIIIQEEVQEGDE